MKGFFIGNAETKELAVTDHENALIALWSGRFGHSAAKSDSAWVPAGSSFRNQAPPSHPQAPYPYGDPILRPFLASFTALL